MKYEVKGWANFQQYKDDRPMHWIKLHTSFLDDYQINQLSELSQLHLMKLWLIAAKNKGIVEGDAQWLARLVNAKKVDLDELVRSGFLVRTEPYETLQKIPREEERRVEESREEKKREEDSKNIVALKPDEAVEVFNYWRSVMDHPRAQLDGKRKALINKSLRLYPSSDLKLAVHGCSVTPFNMGDNDRGQVYDSLAVILKDADQIDRFMKNSKKPPTGKVTTIAQSVDKYAAQTARIQAHIGQTNE